MTAGERLEVIGVSATSGIRHGITSSCRSIVIVSDRWSSAGPDGQRQITNRVRRNAFWISADSCSSVGNRVRLQTALLNSRTVGVQPASYSSVLKGTDTQGLRTSASFSIDVTDRDSWKMEYGKTMLMTQVLYYGIQYI